MFFNIFRKVTNIRAKSQIYGDFSEYFVLRRGAYTLLVDGVQKGLNEWVHALEKSLHYIKTCACWEMVLDNQGVTM